MWAGTGPTLDGRRLDSLLEQLLHVPAPKESGPDPSETTDYDSYGFPGSERAGTGASWASFLADCIRRGRPTPQVYRDWVATGAFSELAERLDADRHLSAVLPVGYPRRPPGVLVEIRGRGVKGILEEAANLVDGSCRPAHAVSATGLGLKVYDAGLYWIPGFSAAACLTSEPPDPELLDRVELPFDSVLVGFSEPVPVGMLIDEIEHLVIDTGGAPRVSEPGDERYLEAVWLSSGPGGQGLGPVAVWFLQHGSGREEAATSATAGVWAKSSLKAVVPNLAALLTWEEWEEPQPAAGFGLEGSREWKKALKASSTKRAAQRGSLHGIRVLAVPDKERSLRGGSGADGEPTGRRSPIEHWRRGHWTSVRVATRDSEGAIVGRLGGEKDIDWHYEGRWIRPVIVNRGGEPDKGAKVYRIG